MTRIAVRRNRPNVRRCVLLAVLLAGTAAFGGGSSPPKEVSPRETPSWRRTRDGWEQPPWLATKLLPRVVPFHPLLAALLVVLVAAMALVGYEQRSTLHAPPPSPHFYASATGASLELRQGDREP